MFPQGLEPCCFPLPEGRRLLLSFCGSLHPWRHREHLHRAAPEALLSLSASTPLGRASSVPPACHMPLCCHSCPQRCGTAIPPPHAVLTSAPSGCSSPSAPPRFSGHPGLRWRFSAGCKSGGGTCQCHHTLLGGQRGAPCPGHSLQGHQPVVGQQGLGQEGGPVLLDGIVLEAVGDRSEATCGCFHSRARGCAGLQGSGHLPWGLLALIPGLRKESGPQASLTRSLLPSSPMGYPFFHETAPWELPCTGRTSTPSH